VPVVAGIVVLLAALALGGCAVPDFDSFRTPDASTLFRPRSVANINEKVLGPVTAADTVDAEGRCAAVSTPTNVAASESGPAPEQSGAPLIASGIAIDMTECDVVNRAGAPERVEIGTNQRSERTATLTYVRGARPGIYHFTAGRLTSMERAPEPPAPQKPAKPQKRAPKPAQTAGR
jgi:hypothetical protein